MDLPFVLDIAIGLVFIFLILSLLASEIQELLTTLLQWRAKHLRDAIEVLLSGEIETQNQAHAAELVSKLYDDPLIRNINQRAKGVLPRMFRAVTRWLIPGNRKGSFGTRDVTGPSYIAPDTFATSLLERVGLATLIKKLVEIRLEKFARRIVGIYQPKLHQHQLSDRAKIQLARASQLKDAESKGRIRSIAESLGLNVAQDENFEILVDEFDDILSDFRAGEASLTTSVERMGESFDAYIATYPIPDAKFDAASSVIGSQKAELIFSKRLKNFKQGIFGEGNQRAIISGGLRPTLSEIADLLNQESSTYQEVADAYQELVAEGKKIDLAVLPSLKEELLETHLKEVEHLLISRHLNEITVQLKQINPKLQQSFSASTSPAQHQFVNAVEQEPEQKLKTDPAFASQAQKMGYAAVRQQRSLPDRITAWFVQQVDRFTVADRRLPEKRQQRITVAAFNRLDDSDRRVIARAVLNTLSNRALYGKVKDGKFTSFGLIEIILSKLPDEDRHQLVDRVFVEALINSGLLRGGNGWQNREFEQQKLHYWSLYENYQTYKMIQQILTSLPASVKESFAILARRAQTQVQRTEQSISQFREEVAIWFDRSMVRASGVYKRNAKGVSLLIGLLLVTFTNIDAGFIVDRLSNNVDLRNVVTTRAISSSGSKTLDKARTETNEALKELALPIGWSPANIADQLDCKLPDGSSDLPSDWSGFHRICLKNQVNHSQANQSNQTSPQSLQSFFGLIGNLLKNLATLVVSYPVAILRILLGWLIAGIAISMGAPFWFDLLGRIVNVRNSGGKPASVDNQSAVKSASAKISAK